MSKRSINHKLLSYRTLIVNSRNPDIAPLLANFGVDAAYLNEGDAILADTERLMELQKKEYQEERAAFDLYYAQKMRWKKCSKKPGAW